MKSPRTLKRAAELKLKNDAWSKLLDEDKLKAEVEERVKALKEAYVNAEGV